MVQIVEIKNGEKNKRERVYIVYQSLRNVIKRAKIGLWMHDEFYDNLDSDDPKFDMNVYKKGPWCSITGELMIRVIAKRKDLIVEIYNPALYDIVKAEMANAAEQIGIKKLVLILKEE